MSLSRENIISTELTYFKSDLAKEPAFIVGEYNEEYGYESEGRCVYKTEDNRKCAVGALLKPALYKPVFDEDSGTSVKGLPDNVQDYLGQENIDWLLTLQNCHDECARNWNDEKSYGEWNHFGKWFLACATEKGLLTA